MDYDEYIGKIPVENLSKLDDMIRHDHLVWIAEVIVNWQLLAPFLQLHHCTVRDIAISHNGNLKLQG